MDSFKQIINQIPSQVYSDTKQYLGSEIALMKPISYASDVTLHTEDYHLTFPVQAPPPVKIGNKEYHFQGRRIVVFNPQLEVICCKNTVYTDRYSSLIIKKPYLIKIAHELGIDKEIIFSRFEYHTSYTIQQTLHNFIKEIEAYGHDCKLMLDSLNTQIAVTILRELQSNAYIPGKSNMIGSCYVNNAILYLREFYHSNITIDDICREIHITPFHFIRLFKEKTGMTPHEYLLLIRIEHAKALLRINNDSISTVANKCGFVNRSHFSTTFKHITGISPVEFKKMS